MAQRQQLYEIQKQIGEDVNNILFKLENSEVRGASVEQQKAHLGKLEATFRSNNEKLLKMGETTEDYFGNKYFTNIIEVFRMAENKIKEIGTVPQKKPIGMAKEIGTVPQKKPIGMAKEFEQPIQEHRPQQMGAEMQQMMQQMMQMMQQQQQVQQQFLKFSVAQEQQTSLKDKEIPGDIKISDKVLRLQEKEELRTNLLTQFRRKIQKLEESLSEIGSDKLVMLEHQKCSWEKIMVEVKQIYRELQINNFLDEDIDEEMEMIEDHLEKSLKDILIKMSELQEEKSSVSLEAVKIPIFNGDIEEWSSFHNMFNRFVHMSRLPAVEKLLRLKTYVRGEALKIIQNLPITESNYEAAWEILNQRFGNRRILFTKLVDKILDQPNINTNSASSLRNLLNTTNESIQALKAMNVALEDADPILARIIIRKLDKEGLVLYEQNTKKSKEIQNLKDVMMFIEIQCEALEASTSKRPNSADNNKKHQNRTVTLTTEGGSCLYCKKNGHRLRECSLFLALPVEGRNSWVRKTKMCNICLQHKMDKRCFQKTRCQQCGKMHNSLLHINFEQTAKVSTNQTANSMNTNSPANILLATAQVKVKSVNGEYIILRALIDHGSQVTTLSEEASQILGLPRIKTKTEIHGLGGVVVGVSNAKTRLTLKPRFISNQFVETYALILPQLTGAQPNHSFKFNINEWNNFVLADPALNRSDRIDVVIGMDIITNIVEDGLFKKDGILAQSTIFGWILSGIINKKNKSGKVLAAVTNLERFWELEEVTADSHQNEEDEECLQLFKKTTKVDADNRLVVKIPIKEEDNELGNSKKQAMARFLSLERKLNVNQKLKEDYHSFMKEYLQLGHMELVDDLNSGKYYLPHQAVIRESSLTTKLRVVFDASAKTTNGKSLNDIMRTGPKLQHDIFDILTKWRIWKFVITADVEKMYRQIRVSQNDQLYQYILWRENKEEAIKEYKLTTVTYGTASAPFLAVRSLFYIADNCENEEIKNIIKEDFYMDDLMTGADTVKRCKEISLEIQNHLASYGFNLRKWLSNNLSVSDDIRGYSDNSLIQIKDDESVKTLGLQWDPVKDDFRFNINFAENGNITKRHVLSEVSKIFDPLGWLSPVTVVAKLFIQKLWLLHCTWDEVLSEEMKEEWQQFTMDLPNLHKVRIPRWLQIRENVKFDLHGFADASERAYAAVIYLKVGESVTLLVSKTKVNPIKNRKTLPKLELCAANLLAKLLYKVSNIIKRQYSLYAWSDSTITLAWIANNRNKDKFVRNRVAEIINIIPNAKWNYVCSKENPADVASRGISALKLNVHSLWWNGPEWLKLSSEMWPKKEEGAKMTLATTISTNSPLLREIIGKYSSYTKLQRIVAYIFRFISKLRKRSTSAQYLNVDELEIAEKKILCCHQEAEFYEDIMELRRSGTVKRNSKLSSLFPFIDKDGLLRVGGRLQNSNLPYNQQHPIIMRKSTLTTSLIAKIHGSTLHGGNRLVEATLRRKYWIIDMKNCVKKFIRGCSKCIRYNKENAKQLMGNLPESRITVSAPFQHVGVDYAGPIQVRCSKGRGQKSFKAYIAVFVCMATKAIHLEAVSDLTAEAFLAALKRFFGRRGVCSDIYSDNGTNFVGANRKLDEDLKEAIRKNESIIPILATQSIRWHFIPPAAPHFGGIWEAGVKSVKFHLKRVIGETKLTYEEISTLLVQIEAVLNSRPLAGLNSDDSTILDVLTPGHFLIGRPLNDCPEHVNEHNISSLDKWKLIQKLRKDFWSRWKDEYLTTLQQRNKWKIPYENIESGTIVLVKDENTSPACWPLARVTETHCGKDGKVRVATLKLQNNTIKRPINKLCPLVKAEANEQSTPPVRSCLTIRRKEKSSMNWMGIFLMLLLIKTTKTLHVDSNNGAEIEEIAPNIAIYLNNVGQLNTVNSKWNLVLHYDLSLHFEEIKKIGKIKEKLDGECSKLNSYKGSCKMIMSAVERKYNLLVWNNELLLDEPRKKRAPFEFIGSLYNVLFGMMDANDREEMEANMKNILSNQYDLNDLIQRQTSVLDSTINVLKKTTEDVNENFKKMHSQLQAFYEEISKERSDERLTLFFSILAMQLNMMIDECQRIQSSVISMLIDVNHGHINTDLLSPSELQKQLVEIEKVMPKDLVLPGKEVGTELKEVYHSMEAKGIITERRLMVQLVIPLVQAHSSEVYEIIKLPVIGKSNVMVPRVEDEFIVYNFASNMYFLISQAKLNKCEKNLQGQYNCIGNMPWRPAVERACEVSALKQSQHAECNFEAVPKQEVWKQLSIENQWIFTVFDNFMLTVDCGQNKRNWITLPFKGILKLSHGCTATYKGISMSASYFLKSEAKSKIGASSWGLESDEIEGKLVKPFDVTIINNTNDITQMKGELTKMRDKVNLRGLQFHEITGHTSLILIIVIIIVFIFIIIKKKCCKTKNIVKIDFSTPLPLRARQNVQNEHEV